MSGQVFYKALFFSLLAAYPLAYAPFGINETDGGFITGLAWQVLCGKQLYTEVIYVRPPLTVWLRALELWLLPTDWAVLAERVFFYLKVGGAAWLAADCLAFGQKKWQLAALGFVVSAHCYPAAAWHTVDGILLASLALWLFFKRPNSLIFNGLSGISAVAAMLCKQSFYPLAGVVFAVAVFLFWKKKLPGRGLASLAAGFFGAAAAFLLYLKTSGAWPAFFEWTAGAGNPGDLWRHGFLDYLQISPIVVGFVAAGTGIEVLVRMVKKPTRPQPVFWGVVAGLMGSYFFEVVESQSFMAPFGQARLLFVVSFFLLLIDFFQKREGVATARFAAFLSISWMSAISWGYNLPILCATPLVFGAWEVREWQVDGLGNASRFVKRRPYLDGLALAGLVVIFFVAYQNIYRDGPRPAMTEPMAEVFPKLRGIYSDAETRDRYLELRQFSEKYGANMAVVPSFPQADYLLGNRPVSPIDWESSWETNGRNEFIFNVLEEKRPTVLVEKTYGDRLLNDPKFAVARWVIEHFDRVGESPNFWVYQPWN